MKFNFDNTYIKQNSNLFEQINPVPVGYPYLLLINNTLAKELKINIEGSPSQLANYFSGNTLIKGSNPIAMAYSGHQFGNFTVLGDGRALLLGEHINNDNGRFDIQLKGSGRTKYSRGGDGRATLYSMLREYLISEAVHYLGISSSRSLALVKSPDIVSREQNHTTGILTRVMKSHIRIAHFEHISQFENKKNLSDFLNYTVNRLYPELNNSEDKAFDFFKAVMHKQIDLVLNWMRVGFVHGVLNTDNTSISAETFDYGPCAFMNTYDLNTCYSSIDKFRRYAYGQQPGIIRWNLSILANAIFPLIIGNKNEKITRLNKTLDDYIKIYSDKYLLMLANKIGFNYVNTNIQKLCIELLNIMTKQKLDYTNTFIDIEKFLIDKEIPSNFELKNWCTQWKLQIKNKNKSLELMQQNNPYIIPRNQIVEQALNKASTGNMELFNTLLEKLKKPYNRTQHKSYFTNYNTDFDQDYKTFCGT